MQFLQVLANHYRLCHNRAVIEFQGRHLPTGILVGIRRFAVLCCQNIVLQGFQLYPLFDHEHAHHAWIGTHRIE